MMATMLPTAATPVDRLLATFNRAQLAGFIEVAIGLLDIADGDPDDDTGGTEDEPLTGFYAMAGDGPGCTVSDAAEPDDDAKGDVSWTEWHTRSRHKVDATGAEIVGRDRHHALIEEDVEEDDAPEAAGDEDDGSGSEDDFMLHRGDGPGCPIADAPEPTLGAPERFAGDWRANMGGVDDGEGEPSHQPPTMDGPTPANDG